MFQYGFRSFIHWVKIYYCDYFNAWFKIWPIRAISWWLLCSFDMSHQSLRTFLPSLMRCSRLILYFCCLFPEISHFSKQPQFILVENGILKLRSRCSVCCLLLLGYSFQGCQWTKPEKICIYMYLHTFICMYVHTFISIIICLSLSIENHKFTLMPPIIVYYHGVHFSFLTSMFKTPFSDC